VTPWTVDIGRPAGLAVAEVDRLARLAATARVSDEAYRRMERSHAFVKRLAEEGAPVYGLTTGCGPLASSTIAADMRAEFQRNLILSHATTLGAAHPTVFVRAAMAVRAHGLALGYSGVDPGVVDLLVAMLNEGIHPLVREVGSVGASGDLVELAEIALALIGEGTVEHGGRNLAACEALSGARLAPIVPRHREGLALMNGTSFHTGTAAILLARARRVMAAAEVGAALSLDALRGHIEAFAPELHRLRPHAGQLSVAERVRHLVRDSSLLRHGDGVASRQDAYSLRCIPQVLGPVCDTLDVVEKVITTEINSVTDNPVFLAEEVRVVHGGNFHGQPVAMALDQLKIAAVEIGVMVERSIARILDPALNDGLPPFLVRDRVGMNSGFMGLQYCASSMAAENAVLAAPASVQSVPTNANNQDVVSMGMVAARQAARVLDNVARMVAIELLCAAEALDLRGAAAAGIGTREAHAAIRSHVEPLTRDRPLAADVDAVCELIEAEVFSSLVS
jgi:histidine ammonia-lyase